MTAQRLTIPEPTIKLYKDGFDATERGVVDLGRKEDGKKLSDLVEKITEPMVIAVDAPWGAGKSVFLKCWVGAHTKENEGTATTVYFDAFASDYMDDPLIALIAAVTHRFEKENANLTISDRTLSALNSVKKYAPALGRGLLKFGINIATARALREIENQEQSLLDDAIKSGADVITPATDKFWERELGQKQIMENFRHSLTELAADQKLVIVVDELDRCRPDYALNLLEVIKHFFNVENVHFILGVNLTELENSVRARYGAGVNAGLYLQKFVTVTMRLHDHERGHQLKKDYLETLCRKFSVPRDRIVPMATTYLGLAADSSSITLRGLQHFTRSLAVSPSCWDEWVDSSILNKRELLRVGLLFLNSFQPHLISRLKQKQLTYEDVAKVLHLPDPRQASGAKEQTTVAWMLCLQQHENSGFFHDYFPNDAESMMASFDYSTLLYIWNKYASVFELTR